MIIDIKQMVQMLAERGDTLVPQLVAGRREGKNWRALSTREGGLGDSLYVGMLPPYQGIWHLAGEPRGDILNLIAFTQFNGDKKRAFAWARDWLGLDRGDGAVAAPAPVDPAALAEAEAARAAERVTAMRKAKALWLNGKPILDTPVESYLAGRAIDLSVFPEPPGALRFHAGVWHKEAAAEHPAMLAAVTGADGHGHLATHITYLGRKADFGIQGIVHGTWGKLGGFTNKKLRGPYSGGLIPLQRGLDNKPLRDAATGSAIHLTEGIEDGLSVAMAMPEARVAAAISVGNMAAIARGLHPAIKTVMLWAQNDAPGSEARKVLGNAIDAFLESGRRVSIPQLPNNVKDANDMLRGNSG